MSVVRPTFDPQRVAEQRLFVVRELASTETTYSEVLQAMHDAYAKPLAAFVPESDLALLFPQLPTILGFSLTLRDALNEKLAQWQPDTTVGDVFLRVGPFLKATMHFVNGHEAACALVDRWMASSAEFRAVASRALADPRAKANNLKALLIAPIQRVPRYILLVDSLLHRTPEAHPDHALLEKALALLRQIADSLNSSKALDDHAKRFLAAALEMKPMIDDLIEPHRSLLLDGTLVDVDKNKPYRYLLLSDMLIKLSLSKIALGRNKGKHNLKAVCSLHNARLASDRGGSQTFAIDFGGTLTFTLLADSQKTKDEWVSALNVAFPQFARRALSYREPPQLGPFDDDARISAQATIRPSLVVRAPPPGLLSSHRLLAALTVVVAAIALYLLTADTEQAPATPQRAAAAWLIAQIVPSSAAAPQIGFFVLALVLAAQL